eukprot:7191816-Lingulodinium_polyedra.AAC.1
MENHDLQGLFYFGLNAQPKLRLPELMMSLGNFLKWCAKRHDQEGNRLAKASLTEAMAVDWEFQ